MIGLLGLSWLHPEGVRILLCNWLLLLCDLCDLCDLCGQLLFLDLSQLCFPTVDSDCFRVYRHQLSEILL